MSGHAYQALYCEENVWQLLAEARFGGLRRWALFITNVERRVALAKQRAARPEESILWDYHVVAVIGTGGLEHAGKPDELTLDVWDLDSRLPLPCPLDVYLKGTFPVLDGSTASAEPRFRLVPDAAFRATFSSDRRHMRGTDGRWLAPPPPWAPPGEGHTLERYLDLGCGIAGEVHASVVDLRLALWERAGTAAAHTW